MTKISLEGRILVTAAELGKLTGVGNDQVQEWLHDPTFPAYRERSSRGARYQIPVAEVQKWFAQKAKNRENMPRTLKKLF